MDGVAMELGGMCLDHRRIAQGFFPPRNQLTGPGWRHSLRSRAAAQPGTLFGARNHPWQYPVTCGSKRDFQFIRRESTDPA